MLGRNAKISVIQFGHCSGHMTAPASHVWPVSRVRGHITGQAGSVMLGHVHCYHWTHWITLDLDKSYTVT